ncbi:MAG: sensor histidine kinase [Chloroflexia bacterium]
METSFSLAEIAIVGHAAEFIRRAATVLQAAGYVAYTADEDRLLHTIATRSPDLILLAPTQAGDIRQTVRRLKGASSTLVPIIVVAPAEDLAAATAALDAGADEFIPHTAGNAELLIRVRAMLRLKRAYDALAELNTTLEQKVQERTQELERAHASLRQAEKLSSLGRLSATVAHEINNPLTGILGLLDLIRGECPEDCTTNPHLHQDLKKIDRQIEAIAHLVRQLRDFSKPPRRERRPVVLNQVVQDVLSLVGKELRKRRIEVVPELEPELPAVCASPEQMGEILLNLVLNAQDAMPEGGQLHIRTQVRDGQVYLQVADTGIGMPPEVLEHVFEPFFTTKGEQGTGLGLAICYSIVREHGGEIRAESQVGRGSTFIVLLPALQASPDSEVGEKCLSTGEPTNST